LESFFLFGFVNCFPVAFKFLKFMKVNLNYIVYILQLFSDLFCTFAREKVLDENILYFTLHPIFKSAFSCK
jgi:hypothetical protein